MIKYPYEENDKRLFELVEEDDFDGLEVFLATLKQNHEDKLKKIAADPATKKLGKFAGLLEFEDYHINRYMKGKTLVMRACENGNLKMIKLLVDHGGDITYADNHRMNVLHYAVEGAYKEIENYLIGEGLQKDDQFYYEYKMIPFGCRYDIPLLTSNDPKYKEKYINAMRLKEEDPVAFNSMLRWN